MALVIVDDKIWTGSADGTIRVWNMLDGSPISDPSGNEVVLKAHSGWVTGLVLAGDQVFSGSTDKTLW
jgi:WD40 repeat protein